MEELLLLSLVWGVQISECGIKRQYPDDEVSGRDSEPTGKKTLFIMDSEDDRKAFFLSNAWETSVWRRLYVRTFLDGLNLRFPENMRMEDTAYTLSVLMECSSLARTDKCLYLYYINPESTMNSEKTKDYYMESHYSLFFRLITVKKLSELNHRHTLIGIF